MAIKVGINGFGRIGRNVLRAIYASGAKDIEVVHINDLVSPQAIAHLLKYDSVHGRFPADVSADNSLLRVGDQSISISGIRSPAELPWKEKGVDVVFECTGLFTKKEEAEGHLKAGAPKVLISAPAKDEDLTVVYGVNHEALKSEHKVISNGSCTTNCLAPPAMVVHRAFSIFSGLVTTIHSYTNDQRILDLPHKDPRRSRAAALNMIPTTTGAAKALGLVLPELKGKVDGMAIRVPTPNVSLVDATFSVKKNTSVEEVNRLLVEASEGPLRGVMACTDEPLVSQDFNGDSHSSVIDLAMTKVIDGNLVKLLAWYDNETGFSHRMLDVARLVGNEK